MWKRKSFKIDQHSGIRSKKIILIKIIIYNIYKWLNHYLPGMLGLEAVSCLETVSRSDFEVLVLRVQVMGLILVLRVEFLVLVLRVEVLVLSRSRPPRSSVLVQKYCVNMPYLIPSR